MIPSRRCLCPTSARICRHYSTCRSENSPRCHHTIRQTVTEEKASSDRLVNALRNVHQDPITDPTSTLVSKKISDALLFFARFSNCKPGKEFLNAFVYTIAYWDSCVSLRDKHQNELQLASEHSVTREFKFILLQL